MDKRTILFVIALAMTLFFVNMYFDQQRQDELRSWNEKTKTARTAKAKQFEAEIAAETVKPDELPLVDIYSDKEGHQFLSTGVETEKGVLALSWSTTLPDSVYVRKHNSKQDLTPVKLASSTPGIGAPALYLSDAKGKLSIGELPDFGKFKLQLLVPNSQNPSNPFSILLGNYEDGRLTLPALQLEQLKLEEPVQGAVKVSPEFQKNAIILLKADSGYLPVALYQQGKAIDLDDIKNFEPYYDKPQVKIATTGEQKAVEKYYVIETPYQQLVFSNYGGALAEINLPFKSGTDKESVVREIEFDREMISHHPYNAYFPSQSYTGITSDGTRKENLKGVLGGFYPLIRRDLIQTGNKKSVHIPPRFYALNIVSEYPELAELVYEVKEFTKNKIVFEAQQRHRRITKTFTVDADNVDAPYSLNLKINVDGDSRGLWLTSGIPEVEWISGGAAPTLKFRITRNEKPYVETLDLPQESLTVTSVYPDWLADSNGFFGVIMDPLSKIDPGYKAVKVPGQVAPSRLVELDNLHGHFKAEDLPGYMMMLPLKADGGEMQYRIFAGPFADSVLKTVDKTYTDSATGANPDYIGAQSFHGWFTFISEPFARFLFILMKFFYQVTSSWGFSIILLTVALRIMMYPLNAWSTRSMVKMQQIAPEVAAIQERYKKDPKKSQIEVMNLYRERGVNPMSGCFPMLIQMPFLIGMFDLLKSMFELRGASFIPGWIDDLTAPDVLFSWNTPIMFIGNEFHLLPFILGGVMFLQQRMSSTMPKDPALMTDQQRQQKAMGTIMSLVFTLMFYNFPSGLNIYWLSSMLLGMLQQWWMTKRMKNQPAVVVLDKPKKK
jgi:YidC/Oxa1 family membrane protein insertase